MNQYQNSLDKVVNGGYCIGCGACSFMSQSIDMSLDKYGLEVPLQLKPIDNSDDRDIQTVCPFSDKGDHEDEISNNLFGSLPKHNEIGHYDQILAGRVVDSEWYENGSSGGIGKWLLYKLLDLDLVDYVIQVTETKPQDDKFSRHFKYKVTSNNKEVILGSKSAYYPIELSEILSFIEQNPGRYAITGIPCFIKTIRRLSITRPLFKERIIFTIGVVCGHLKSKSYAELIGWQLGIKPEKLDSIDFRKKIPGTKANQKGVIATSIEGIESPPEIVQNIYGTIYGHGFFKYEACDYCDDVVGETADISIGDAWLPEFLDEETSLIIIRNPILTKLFSENSSELKTSSISAKMAANSQRGGLKHRRDYLKYRLFLKEQSGNWVPKKRVSPEKKHIDWKSRKIVRLRSQTSLESHIEFLKAKNNNQLDTFITLMKKRTNLLTDLSRKTSKFYMARILRWLNLYRYTRRGKKEL